MNASTMNAVISTAYGSPDVFDYTQVSKPVPADNEILIRIHATSVTNASTAIRTGYPLFGRLVIGLSKPNNPISGTDLSGVVEAIGKKVTRFSVGDAVFGSTDMDFGTYAEYKTLHEDAVILQKPERLSHFEATAIIDGATTAYPFLDKAAQLSHGQRILINGASGSIGTAAIQIAHLMGATVTAVASGSNKSLIMGLGVHKFIDYTKENYWELSDRYDIVFDTVGKSSFNQAKNVLVPQGKYLTPVLTFANLFAMLSSQFSGGKKAIFMATGMLPDAVKKKNFDQIFEWLNDGKITPVIDRIYHLPNIAEAHRYVDKGHKKGNVVVNVIGEDNDIQ